MMMMMLLGRGSPWTILSGKGEGWGSVVDQWGQGMMVGGIVVSMVPIVQGGSQALDRMIDTVVAMA